MGRKTWESLPKKPLPGRLNIIISKTMSEDTLDLTQRHGEHGGTEGRAEEFNNSPCPLCPPCLSVKICKTIPEAIQFCSNYEKIFICGGESIYTQVLPLANKIELTLIPGLYEGDTFFPEIDTLYWTKTKTENFDNFSIVTYTKTNNEKELL